MECCTSNIASLHQENPDPPSKNRVGGFEVVTYSCPRVIRPQALEPHHETYTTTTTTVSDVVEWLSKDPIGISGGLNQYVFCGNNPVMFQDPFGLCEKKVDTYDGLKHLQRYRIDLKNDWNAKNPWNPLNWIPLYQWSTYGYRDIKGYKHLRRYRIWNSVYADFEADEFGNFVPAIALEEMWGTFTARAILMGANALGFGESYLFTKGQRFDLKRALEDNRGRKRFQGLGLSGGSIMNQYE